jgi:3-isopropylmalate/(R)-2-methylmalate dehydratase small subunit
MLISGKAWKFGHDVDTDAIIPARYLNTSDIDELASHCMEDADPEFPDKVQPGDIIVAGKNFGCGSSREHAPIAIKGAKVGAVIADSYARIFYRNAFNTGLPILECKEASDDIESGDEIAIDLDTGRITNKTRNISYQAQPTPPFMRELLELGGLVPYVRRQREKKN